MVDDHFERAREEFQSEAQELVEAMSRDLLVLDQALKHGRHEPETLNDLFRNVHTLKGLAGMFGLATVSQLAHSLEDLMEALRLGRIDLSQRVLDLLFEGVDNFQRCLAHARDGLEADDVDPVGFAQALAGLAAASAPEVNIVDQYDIDPSVLSVLTEYEEHRLRANLEQGNPIYRLKLCLSLDVIDTALEDLKARARSAAEIITYLPSMDAGIGDTIDIEVLLASRVGEAELRELLNRPDAHLSLVERRRVRRDSSSAGLRGETMRPQTVHATPSWDPATSEQQPLAEAPTELLSLRSVTRTVRVDISKLDHLMNVVGELAIVRGTVARMLDAMRRDPEQRKRFLELQRINRNFERHLSELQEGVLDVRMVPLGQLFDKLGRVTRQVARDRGKDVRLVVTGTNTEVDKLIAEELADPLMHIVRNAVDHGIESADERLFLGKPESGTIAISAYQRGNHVVIDVQDDGAGIDPSAVLQKAVAMRLLREEQVGDLSREELLNVIFQPGFSTAQAVTDLSGRGVGMDVVKTNITRLGGVIDLQSELGVGTKFTITLPITLAIISALIVEVAGRTLAMPLASVQEALRLDAREIRRVDGREVITLRGTTLSLSRLQSLLNYSASEDESAARKFVVVVAVGTRRVGFIVDALGGQEDVVIKNLGPTLRDVRGIAGATDRGDQRLVLVLDPSGLLDEVLDVSEARALSEARS